MPASRKLFVNLPVQDLARSTAFFASLGFSFNPDFTDENATCMLIGEDAYAMLLVRPFFQGFTKMDIPDTARQAQLICAVGVDSREEVDTVVSAAAAGEGTEVGEAEDLGFMYSRNFADPDGHLWSVFWMDESQVPDAEGAVQAG